MRMPGQCPPCPVDRHDSTLQPHSSHTDRGQIAFEYNDPTEACTDPDTVAKL